MMNYDSKIDDNTYLRRNQNIVFNEIDNEIVILSVKYGEYYNFNEVSSYIWKELKHKSTFMELISLLMKKYEVSEEVCRRETKDFISKTSKKGLIEIINE